ncbi:MAG TPA: UDP-N-acetylglucosamine 1-carboxyvinyltransferase [Firmicutes bacterium]|nr:UDP-N-acetylglucosamine 1-carboxyvinyltransferase [Bacillota bacterium]
MGMFIVEGRHSLRGTLRVNGAKNSALKLMAAALLGQGRFIIDDVPQITDVFTMASVLEGLGVRTELRNNRLELLVSSLQGTVPEESAKSMRASVQVIGPLLARLGWVKVVMPGGCAIGTRPLDLHLSGLRRMGAEIEVTDKFIMARAKRLHGADIKFRYPSVGATENIMMAATLAKGDTIIRNAAREPEIEDIQDFLNKMGACIEGAGTSTIKISGVGGLGSADGNVIPDRIEAGTYLLAFLLTGGSGTLTNVRPEHLVSLLDVMRRMGAVVEAQGHSLTVEAPAEIKPFRIFTGPHPGFPTDLQPQIAVAATQAQGVSVLIEAVFDQRFGYTSELRKLGADFKIRGKELKVYGPTPLLGAKLHASDLRAGAALVLAALAAEGQTIVGGIEHIDRGYESMEEKLRQLGAKIVRVPD